MFRLAIEAPYADCPRRREQSMTMESVGACGVATPVGRILIAAGSSGICRVTLRAAAEEFEFQLGCAKRGGVARKVEWTGRPAGALAAAADQIEAYFRGERHAFDLTLDLRGQTPFQRRVMDRVARIPWGTVISYGEVAALAGAAGAARAVGGVMAQNPLPILVPCHRVVASGGRLGGYGGGLDLKRALLTHEGVNGW